MMLHKATPLFSETRKSVTNLIDSSKTHAGHLLDVSHTLLQVGTNAAYGIPKYCASSKAPRLLATPARAPEAGTTNSRPTTLFDHTWVSPTQRRLQTRHTTKNTSNFKAFRLYRKGKQDPSPTPPTSAGRTHKINTEANTQSTLLRKDKLRRHRSSQGKKR